MTIDPEKLRVLLEQHMDGFSLSSFVEDAEEALPDVPWRQWFLTCKVCGGPLNEYGSCTPCCERIQLETLQREAALQAQEIARRARMVPDFDTALRNALAEAGR